MNKESKVTAGDLNSALAAIMGEVRSLAKEDKNAHGGYTFAGIDAFLDLTRPLCAKHSLTIRQDEDGFEVIEVPSKNGPQKMLLMRFGFSLVHGSECDGPYHRSIMVPASMGSQAFGAAQSYTLKQFLRSLFQISTGEKSEDIDAHNTGELGTYSRKANGRPNPPTPPADEHDDKFGLRQEGDMSDSALRGAIKAIVHHINGCSDLADLLGYLDTPEAKDAIEQCQRRAPTWWETGHGMPKEFKPLRFIIEDRKRELQNGNWNNAHNPILAG